MFDLLSETFRFFVTLLDRLAILTIKELQECEGTLPVVEYNVKRLESTVESQGKKLNEAKMANITTIGDFSLAELEEIVNESKALLEECKRDIIIVKEDIEKKKRFLRFLG